MNFGDIAVLHGFGDLESRTSLEEKFVLTPIMRKGRDISAASHTRWNRDNKLVLAAEVGTLLCRG